MASLIIQIYLHATVHVLLLRLPLQYHQPVIRATPLLRLLAQIHVVLQPQVQFLFVPRSFAPPLLLEQPLIFLNVFHLCLLWMLFQEVFLASWMALLRYRSVLPCLDFHPSTSLTEQIYVQLMLQLLEFWLLGFFQRWISYLFSMQATGLLVPQLNPLRLPVLLLLLLLNVLHHYQSRRNFHQGPMITNKLDNKKERLILQLYWKKSRINQAFRLTPKTRGLYKATYLAFILLLLRLLLSTYKSMHTLGLFVGFIFCVTIVFLLVIIINFMILWNTFLPFSRLLNFLLFVNFLLNFGGFWRASFAN